MATEDVRSEDSEHTLIFVDMLGFTALTEKYQKRLLHSQDNEHGFRSTSTSAPPNQLMRFQRVLESAVFDYSLKSNVRAMLFSDCAFLDFGNSLLAAIGAAELMRNLIQERVPVRMGLGRGTFYPLKLSTDLTGSTIVARAAFFGTAIIYAHAAERCGGKGLRIFVHPSVEPELTRIQGRVKILTLATSYNNAKWELDFLYEQTPALKKRSADDGDKELFTAIAEMYDRTVAEMHNQAMPEGIQCQYSETIKAMNRMRIQYSRPVIRIQADFEQED